MTSTSIAQRVLVHLKNGLNVQKPTLGRFTDCVVNKLNGNSDKDEMLVNCELSDGKLILAKAESEKPSYLLKHLDVCPMKMLNEQQLKDIPEDIMERGINVGVVALVESSDKKVLITRRAPHMRTFPGNWVPPGGGIENDETLIQTALRELEEETGLSLESSIKSQSDILCLWESVFYPKLDIGPPKRHHIVVYFHLEVRESSTELNKRLQLQAEEVDAAVWLSESLMDVVVNGCPEDEREKAALGKTFQIILLQDGEQNEVECPLEMLTKKVPKKGAEDKGRFTTGTRYALEQLLKKRSNEGRTESTSKL